MHSYLGFADFSIAVIYLLNIGIVLFCLLYGWKAWDSKDKEEQL